MVNNQEEKKINNKKKRTEVKRDKFLKNLKRQHPSFKKNIEIFEENRKTIEELTKEKQKTTDNNTDNDNNDRQQSADFNTTANLGFTADDFLGINFVSEEVNQQLREFYATISELTKRQEIIEEEINKNEEIKSKIKEKSQERVIQAQNLRISELIRQQEEESWINPIFVLKCGFVLLVVTVCFALIGYWRKQLSTKNKKNDLKK